MLRGENASAKTLQSVVKSLESDKLKLEEKVKNLEQKLKENNEQPLPVTGSAGKRTSLRPGSVPPLSAHTFLQLWTRQWKGRLTGWPSWAVRLSCWRTRTGLEGRSSEPLQTTKAPSTAGHSSYTGAERTLAWNVGKSHKTWSLHGVASVQEPLWLILVLLVVACRVRCRNGNKTTGLGIRHFWYLGLTSSWAIYASYHSSLITAREERSLADLWTSAVTYTCIFCILLCAILNMLL